MRVLQKFQKLLNEHEVEDFISLIGRSLPNDWCYDELRSDRFSVLSSCKSFVYIYSGKKFPKCALFLCYDQDKLEVANIVPAEISQLSIDQYNAILTDFVTRVFPEELSNLSSRNLDLLTIMSPDTIKKLDIFCHSANKSSGSGHPCDRERWNQFIISAFLTGDEQKLYDDTLGRILVEIYYWDEKTANELIHEYTFGVDLLRTCRKNGSSLRI